LAKSEHDGGAGTGGAGRAARLGRGLVIAAAGAATGAAHALGGWLLTPFFGDSAFFWSHVAGAPALAIALGLLLGRAAAGGAKQRPRAPLLLGALGGALICALPLVAPPLARAVLDRGPDARFAAPLVIFLAISLPCGLAASTLRLGALGATNPASLRPLGAFVGGAMLALVGGEPLLLDPVATPPWLGLWGAGGLLVLTCGVALGVKGAAVLALVAAAPVAAFYQLPNEAATPAFRDGLARGWTLRAGRYYLETAPPNVLKESELLRHWRAFQGEIDRAREGDAAVLAFVDALRNIGRAKMAGDGLRYVCDRVMAPQTRERLAPLLSRIVDVTSDGRGGFDVAVATDPGEETATVEIAGAEGSTTLEIGRRVTISLRETRSPDGTRACLDVGPLIVEPAGALEKHDTHRTPVIVKRAKLFFDAHLLGIDFDATRAQVAVKVRAQGAIGAIQEKEIYVEERKKR
jgi:hypothetical protein